MESSHLVIFSTSGKFIMKFNVLCCISLSETLFWTGARGRIPITLITSICVLIDTATKGAVGKYDSLWYMCLLSIYMYIHTQVKAQEVEHTEKLQLEYMDKKFY